MPSSSLARVAPRRSFSWVSTPPVDYTRIAQRYGTTTGDKFGDSAPDDLLNPNLPSTRLANSVQANMDVAQRTAAANLRSAGSGPVTVQRSVVPGSSLTPQGDLEVDGPSGPITRDAPVNPATGEPSAMEAERNAEALWAAQGGSERTMHRNQVIAGIRPAIDARTRHSPSEAPSDASAAIIRGFGDGGPGQEGHSPWPATTFGNAGSKLWADMTQRFNDARSNLRATLNPPSRANVVGGPGDAIMPPDLMNPDNFGGTENLA